MTVLCAIHVPLLVKIKVLFENGEQTTVDIQKVEPDGDFTEPHKGMEICCKEKGGRYKATVLESLPCQACDSAPVCHLYMHVCLQRVSTGEIYNICTSIFRNLNGKQIHVQMHALRQVLTFLMYAAAHAAIPQKVVAMEMTIFLVFPITEITHSQITKMIHCVVDFINS